MRISIAKLLQRGLRHHGYVRALGSGYLVMLASIAVQIAVVPLYLDAFGQYQFGVLMILLSLVNFAVIGIAWMSGGALRLLGEYASLGKENAFREAFGLIKAIYVGYGLALAALASLAALVFDQQLFGNATAEDLPAARYALYLVGLYLVIFYGVAVDRIALTARKRQTVANIIQLAGILLSAAGTVAWVLAGGSMPGVLCIQIAGLLISGFLSRRLLDKEAPGLRICWSDQNCREHFRHLGGRTGAGFFLHGALVLLLQADIALMGWLGGAKVAAEFYLVWKIAEVLVQLIWKLPEPMAPYFIQMDVRGEHVSLDRVARVGYALIAMVSLLTGVLYALFGPVVVGLWVGEPQVPTSAYAFPLAGGAIFWLGISRLPVVLAGARVALRQLNLAGSLELAGKLAITLLLFPKIGYLAILVGINLAHLLGGSFLYFRLLRGISPAAQRTAG